MSRLPAGNGRGFQLLLGIVRSRDRVNPSGLSSLVRGLTANLTAKPWHAGGRNTKTRTGNPRKSTAGASPDTLGSAMW